MTATTTPTTNKPKNTSTSTSYKTPITERHQKYQKHPNTTTITTPIKTVTKNYKKNTKHKTQHQPPPPSPTTAANNNNQNLHTRQQTPSSFTPRVGLDVLDDGRLVLPAGIVHLQRQGRIQGIVVIRIHQKPVHTAQDGRHRGIRGPRAVEERVTHLSDRRERQEIYSPQAEEKQHIALHCIGETENERA